MSPDLEIEIKLYYLTELLALGGDYNTSNKVHDFIPYLSNTGPLPQWYKNITSHMDKEDSEYLQKILDNVQKFNSHAARADGQEFTNKNLQDAIWLVKNKDKTLGADYHDAGSCWGLIEAFRFLTVNLKLLQK